MEQLITVFLLCSFQNVMNCCLTLVIFTNVFRCFVGTLVTRSLFQVLNNESFNDAWPLKNGGGSTRKFIEFLMSLVTTVCNGDMGNG